MSSIHPKLKKYLLEVRGMAPGYTGAGLPGSHMSRPTAGMSIDMPPIKKDAAIGDDSVLSVKAVIYKEGGPNNEGTMVVLLKDETGRFDLPGGHVKEGEAPINALQREVFEETGMSIIEVDSIKYSHGNKKFFKCVYNGDIKTSDEHPGGGQLVELEKIYNIDDQRLAPEFKNAIKAAFNEETMVEVRQVAGDPHLPPARGPSDTEKAKRQTALLRRLQGKPSAEREARMARIRNKRKEGSRKRRLRSMASAETPTRGDRRPKKHYKDYGGVKFPKAYEDALFAAFSKGKEDWQSPYLKKILGAAIPGTLGTSASAETAELKEYEKIAREQFKRKLGDEAKVEKRLIKYLGFTTNDLAKKWMWELDRDPDSKLSDESKLDKVLRTTSMSAQDRFAKGNPWMEDLAKQALAGHEEDTELYKLQYTDYYGSRKDGPEGSSERKAGVEERLKQFYNKFKEELKVAKENLAKAEKWAEKLASTEGVTREKIVPAMKKVPEARAAVALIEKKLKIVVADLKEEGLSAKKIDAAARREIPMTDRVESWLSENPEAAEFLKDPPGTEPDADLSPELKARRDKLGAGTPKNMLKHLGISHSRENEEILKQAIIESEVRKDGTVVPRPYVEGPAEKRSQAYLQILENPKILNLMGLSAEDPEEPASTEEKQKTKKERKAFNELVVNKTPIHPGNGKLVIKGDKLGDKSKSYITLKKQEEVEDPYASIARDEIMPEQGAGNLDETIERLFPGRYDPEFPWAGYKRENFKDLTKKMNPKDLESWSGASGPTIHPIIIGLALEEFLDPKASKTENYVGILIVTKETEGQLQPRNKKSIFPDDKAAENRDKVLKILNLRRGFFGGAGKEGALETAMIYPRTGLKNTKIIRDLIEEYNSSKFGTLYNLRKIPLVNPNGQFIKIGRGRISITSKAGQTVDALTGDRELNSFGVPLNISFTTRRGADIKVVIVPRSWFQDSNPLSLAERMLANRVGANVDSGLQISSEGGISYPGAPIKPGSEEWWAGREKELEDRWGPDWKKALEDVYGPEGPGVVPPKIEREREEPKPGYSLRRRPTAGRLREWALSKRKNK